LNKGWEISVALTKPKEKRKKRATL
jgi:hypothetical protein